MRHFGTIFFAAAMFFLAYVLIASSPIDRLNRGCQPVQWVGRAVEAIAAMGSLSAEARAKAATERSFHACRFFFFRQFYQEEYDRLVREPDPASEGGQGEQP